MPIQLKPSDIQLYTYGSKHCLSILGTFKATLTAGSKSHDTTIHVTAESSSNPLLSESSARGLELVQYNENFLVQNVVQEPCRKPIDGIKRKEVPAIVKENCAVFTGDIGKSVARQVDIMIDENVTPVVQRQRKIPLNLMEKAEEKISQLLRQDIIERYPDNEPRSWVSPPVIAPKPNSEDIRFCVDMRMANKAIKRTFRQIPNMEDTVNRFEGAERLRKLYLK